MPSGAPIDVQIISAKISATLRGPQCTSCIWAPYRAPIRSVPLREIIAPSGQACIQEVAAGGAGMLGGRIGYPRSVTIRDYFSCGLLRASMHTVHMGTPIGAPIEKLNSALA